MLLIRSSAAMARALDSPLDETLRALLLTRLGQLTDHALAEIACFLIIESGEDAGDIERELGFSPLSNPIDDTRYGDPDFSPFWEWVERHDGWFELVFVLTDDGFAHVVLVKDGEGVDPSLLSLCREQTTNDSIQNGLIPGVESERPGRT